MEGAEGEEEKEEEGEGQKKYQILNRGVRQVIFFCNELPNFGQLLLILFFNFILTQVLQ